MQQQLDKVISGKQNKVPLAQDFINDIARDSTVFLEKRKLLHTHLSKYVQQIPLHLKKEDKSKGVQYESKLNLPQLLVAAKESKELKLKNQKNRHIWLKKQIAKKKRVISLSSPLGKALTCERKEKDGQPPQKRAKKEEQPGGKILRSRTIR